MSLLYFRAAANERCVCGRPFQFETRKISTLKCKTWSEIPHSSIFNFFKLIRTTGKYCREEEKEEKKIFKRGRKRRKENLEEKKQKKKERY